MSSDTITLELDKYESGVVFHSLKDKRNQMLKEGKDIHHIQRVLCRISGVDDDRLIQLFGKLKLSGKAFPLTRLHPGLCLLYTSDLNPRAALTRPTPLAGAPLQPLEYFS